MRSVPGAEAGIGSAFVIASGNAGALELQHVGAVSVSSARRRRRASSREQRKTT